MLGAARGMLLAAAFPFPLFFAPHTFSSHPYFAACEVHARAPRQRIASPFPIGARCKANPSFSANASGIGLKRSKKGSLAQVPLPILFRTLPRPSLRFYIGHRPSDARAPRHIHAAPFPIGTRYSVAHRFAPLKSLFLRQRFGHRPKAIQKREFGAHATPFSLSRVFAVPSASLRLRAPKW